MIRSAEVYQMSHRTVRFVGLTPRLDFLSPYSTCPWGVPHAIPLVKALLRHHSALRWQGRSETPNRQHEQPRASPSKDFASAAWSHPSLAVATVSHRRHTACIVAGIGRYYALTRYIPPRLHRLVSASRALLNRRRIGGDVHTGGSQCVQLQSRKVNHEEASFVEVGFCTH